MRKWEHCALGPVKNNNGPWGYFTYLAFFDSNGARKEEINDDISTVFAQLGDEGWEMAGGGNAGSAVHFVYFKRPQPD